MGRKREPGSVGEKLQRLREKARLSREELAARVNVKASYLAQVEEGEVLPPVAEIITLARALAVEPARFLAESASPASSVRRRQARAVRTQDYAYETLTAEEPEKHLMAFRVTIEPKSDHRRVGYKHEGEEFIYVLTGQLRIKVGKKTRLLSAGESIHFDSSEKHELRNPGHEPARLLVVIYTP